FMEFINGPLISRRQPGGGIQKGGQALPTAPVGLGLQHLKKLAMGIAANRTYRLCHPLALPHAHPTPLSVTFARAATVPQVPAGRPPLRLRSFCQPSPSAVVRCPRIFSP